MHLSRRHVTSRCRRRRCHTFSDFSDGEQRGRELPSAAATSSPQQPQTLTAVCRDLLNFGSPLSSYWFVLTMTTVVAWGSFDRAQHGRGAVRYAVHILFCVFAGDTFVSNSGTPSSGTSGSSPLSVSVTTSGSSPISTDAAMMPSSVVQPHSSTPKRQTLNELLASIPGFSLRVRQQRRFISQWSMLPLL